MHSFNMILIFSSVSFVKKINKNVSVLGANVVQNEVYANRIFV